MDAKIETLMQVPLFASLPRSEIEHLAATLQPRAYPPGAILLREGQVDDYFCIILQGQVEVIKALNTSDERQLAVCQPGAVLGEMSLFTEDGSHTASVRAQTPVQLLEMTRTNLEALLHRQPGMVYNMVRLLSRRLAESEHVTLLDLREKNRQLTQAYQELQAAQAQIVEKERLERELEIARNIQRSVLPQVLPQPPGYDMGALMVPARAVGGDFYDVIPLGEWRWAILVGDVCDKGVPAALFMTLSYSLLRAEAGRHASPGETLRSVNRHLMGINTSQMFVTLLYGVLDCAAGRLSYARAGHPQPLLLDGSGQVVQLPRAPGQMLGWFDDPLLDEQSFDFPPGGLLLVFSDGLSEATDAQGVELDTERVGQLLSAYGAATAQQVCDRLWEEAQAWTGEAGPQDDFTLLAIRAML
jgi:sigma-B regulation protein RsbU (phosphoserine phosphatase)